MNLQDAPLEWMCREALVRDPTLPAIEWADAWVTWGELRAVAERVSALMRRSGVHYEAPVVFIPRSRPSAVAAFLGVLAEQRTVRMVYPFQSPASLASELAQLEPAIVIAHEEDYTPAVRETLRASGSAAIALSELDATPVRGLEWSRRLEPTGAPALPEIQILTSGTTGRPKRIGLTYAMVARHIVAANKNYASQDLDHQTQPPLYLYYPLGNISGICGVLPSMLRGHRVVLVERFGVDSWCRYIQRYKPARASLPPAGFQMVLDAALPREALAGVRMIATGAAALDESVRRAFVARYEIPVVSAYGATEFGGPVAAMTPELYARWGEAKAGSVGRAIAGAQLRIVDPLTGTPLGAGKEGLLEVIAPNIGSDWIRTSDLAVLDEDGFLFHRGRADGAIVRGGFKLLPETIERALLAHPSVSAAAVVGYRDARLGHVPVAAVQLKPGAAPPTLLELERHLRDRVYSTHIPVAWRLVEALPRTASFKVDLAAVRALFDPAERARSRGPSIETQ